MRAANYISILAGVMFRTGASYNVSMVARDIRQVLRSLARTPLFAGVVVLLLALGLGANTLIFTAVNVLLLRPLPVPHPEQIVRLGVRRSPAVTSYEHPYVYARVDRERAHAFSEVFA